MTPRRAWHVFEREQSLSGDFQPPRDQFEKIGIFRRMFRRSARDETILTKTKPFSAFGASRAKPPMVISFTPTTAQRRRRN